MTTAFLPYLYNINKEYLPDFDLLADKVIKDVLSFQDGSQKDMNHEKLTEIVEKNMMNMLRLDGSALFQIIFKKYYARIEEFKDTGTQIIDLTNEEYFGVQEEVAEYVACLLESEE